ncbi:hypothetical protein QAD02_001000 [Eretmocerus hayati]|uniref:Uncharacterized protein n=1 Tax=Eretmocerus hayati TaxID=131215 RepID=A0ACC2NF82_9HYME|nr:hypothetical protein QAD02_001000 [Eretmocerus hayati]
MSVATILVAANIFFNWLKGPIRKHVLKNRTFKLSNNLGFRANIMERPVPSQGHNVTKCVKYTPWLDFIKCFKSSKYLESRLFPNPPLESVQLKKIWDHRNSSRNRNINESLMANKKLSETLFCAIALKKKLYRLRKSKQEKLAKQVPEEEASNED